MMIRGLPLAVAAVLLTVAFASCSGGTKDGTGVQKKAIEAFKQLESSLVTVNGEVSEKGTDASFQLSYTAVGTDRHQYADQSTFESVISELGVIAIGSDAWELTDGKWAQIPNGELIASSETFAAARIWSLVSFDKADLKGTETINGTKTKHYHASRDFAAPAADDDASPAAPDATDDASTVAPDATDDAVAEPDPEPEAGSGLPIADLTVTLIASDPPEFLGSIATMDIDFWIDAKNGWPVQVKYHGTGDGTFDLTAVLEKMNDESLVVNPP